MFCPIMAMGAAMSFVVTSVHIQLVLLVLSQRTMLLHCPHKCDSRVLTFAGLDALGPCVIEHVVPGISAVFEPSTAVTAAR